jgi:glycosyltransferase involved in cell wall biosynthesis
VDVLIKAFHLVSDEFKDWSLKIVGFCQDRSPFVALASDNDRIAFFDPIWYPEVIALMADCSLFVLPSRTEAMGRVLLEAMASGKPVIGSNVDGIPYVIEHGVNGLLFESENVEDLAAKMRAVISDPAYAARLGERAREFVCRERSEECYLERFSHMIEDVTGAAAERAVRVGV